MKTATELPGPLTGAGLEAGDAGSVRHTHRVSRAAKVALYTILTFFLVAFLLRLPGHHACFKHRLSKLSKSQGIEERVKSILTQTPLIDGHNDLAILVRAAYNNHIYDERFTKAFTEGGLIGHVDIPRLRAGMNGGAFWSAFWPCPSNGTDYSDENYASTVTQTFQQIDLLTRLTKSHPSVFSPPTTPLSTALTNFHHPPHRLLSPLAIEGLHQIGNSAATLRLLHSLGVRYATLTHNCGNRYADSALWERPLRKAPAVWGGVSPAGQKMVREMNRLGMIVDLAHTSVDTMRDVLGGNTEKWAGSRAPVVFSHSSAYAVCPHPRNVPDEVLDLVGRKGGLVMVNFAPDFVACVEAPGREDGLPDLVKGNATLEQVVRHIRHIGERIGFAHVGLGSDFDGIESTPKGLEDVSKFPDLVTELLRQGVSDEDAAKVVGGNLLRVWKAVEDVAEEMQKEGVPVLEDDLPKLWSIAEKEL